jgi:hypothetical protein
LRASIRCVLGDGKSTLFWVDPWLDGQCIAALMPELFEAVSARTSPDLAHGRCGIGQQHLDPRPHLAADCARARPIHYSAKAMTRQHRPRPGKPRSTNMEMVALRLVLRQLSLPGNALGPVFNLGLQGTMERANTASFFG